MRQHNYKLLPLLALVLAVTSPALGRRIRVRPEAVPVEEDQEPRSQRLQYYAAAEAPEAADGQQYVVVPSDDAYTSVYGRQSISRQSDAVEPSYRPRQQIVPGSKQPTARLRDTPKQPPVQTLRNYNKVNDDGSFTFGYEAADGSFKEETRGTDCVVRGKYGYVDPDGNKREFTYVSGNPCDPNAPNEEEEKDVPTDSGEENVPKGPAGRPLRPRPALAAARPTTTVFQNNYVQDEEAEQQQILYTPSPRPQVTARPTSIYQPQPEAPRAVVARPTPQTAIRITPRPHSATTVRSQLPATTYRPRHQVSPTPRPGVVYSNTIQPSPTPHHASPASVDFEETLRQFQLENNVLTTPRPLAQRPQARPQLEPLAAGKGNALYETQLVYDPASGQYNTVFYQNVPQTNDNINLRQRIQPYVQQQQQPAYQPRPQIPQQQVYQQQQATVLQQSQQLFAQQQQRQRALAQQQPQVQEQQQHRFTQFQSPAQRYPLQQQYYQQQQQQQLAKEPTRQQFYYVSPSSATPRESGNNVSHGQIDAFLRGHNIAF